MVDRTDGADWAAVLLGRLDDLREEHGGWLPSVDVCASCSDSECDGVGCIASIDVDNTDHHERLEELHELIRQGRAWRFMQTLRADTRLTAMEALKVAEFALAEANNQRQDELPYVPEQPPSNGSSSVVVSPNPSSRETRSVGDTTP